MKQASEPDYLHPDGKPDDATSLEDLSDHEKYSHGSKSKALNEADGHSIERKDEFLGTEGSTKKQS